MAIAQNAPSPKDTFGGVVLLMHGSVYIAMCVRCTQNATHQHNARVDEAE